MAACAMSRIHPTAVVDPHAELDSEVEIGAFSLIGARIKIGKARKVHAPVEIQGRTPLRQNNVNFSLATVGSMPQGHKNTGGQRGLTIADRNTIREYVSLKPGTAGGG